MRIEQTELRDPAREMLADLGTADPVATWAAVVASGWTALRAPEDAGGLDQPLAAACWLYQELGRARSPAPLAASLVAGDALAACPPSPLRDDLIARIAGGEPAAVSLLDPLAVTLGNDALTATITGVQGAADATHALLVSPGLVAWLPLDRAGVSVVSHPLWDRSRDIADLVLADVMLDEADRLATGAAAEAAARAASVHLHFAVAADSVGAADAILEQTVAYLQTRRQFDRPLAMFQALKHRAADLKTMVVAADALVSAQLQSLEDGNGDPVILARAAKAMASRTFRAVAEEAVQLHGGIGMTMEHPCHLYLKRALLNEHLASADDACDIAVGRATYAALRVGTRVA